MPKIRRKQQNNKISQDSISCGFGKGEDYIFLEFGHMTNNKKYNYDALIDKSENDKKILGEFTRLIFEMSRCTWEELKHRNKSNIAGYETLELKQFKTAIWDQFNPELTNEVKLHVFRFGGKKYRMIGYKSVGCNYALHVLGFDLGFSLYDHGE